MLLRACALATGAATGAMSACSAHSGASVFVDPDAAPGDAASQDERPPPAFGGTVDAGYDEAPPGFVGRPVDAGYDAPGDR
jgi:hypothetical protein